VRLALVPGPDDRAIALKLTRNAKQVLDIERQGFERNVEMGLVHAYGAETARQVAGLAEGRDQQFVDVGSGSRRDMFGVRSQRYEPSR